MKTRIVKIFSIIFIPFFLFSCINIETEITFRQNLSGEISIKYSISKAAINIGKIDKEDNFLPLPIEEQKFREIAANTNGLTFISYRQEETEGELFINVKYGFNNIDALNAIVSNSNDKKVEVQRRGDRTYYTHRISNNKPINEETLDLAKALFPDRYVSVKIIAPQNIRTVSSGDITGNSAQVKYSLTQLLSNKENTTWEVSW